MIAEATSVLTSPPGSLIQNLVLVVVLALILSLALTLRGRIGTPEASRWSAGAGGLLALRVLVALLTGLAWFRGTSLDAGLPPTYRFASLVGVLVLGWVLPVPRPNRPGDIGVALALVVSILGLAANIAAAFLPSRETALGGGWPELAWILAGLVASLVVISLLVVQRPQAWGLSLSAFTLLMGGFAIDLWLRSRQAEANSSSGFVYLAELLAYPLLAVAAIRSLLGEEPGREPASEVTPTPRSSTTGAGPSVEAIEDVFGLVLSDTSSQFAIQAVRLVSRAMRAEYCLLLTPPEPADQFAIAAGYDLISEQYISGSALDSQRVPVISAALSQHRTLSLPARSRSPDMLALQTTLSLARAGPALISPLLAEGDLLGGLVILSPYARHDWSEEDQEAFDIISKRVARRLREVRLAEERAAARAQTQGEVETPAEVNDRVSQRLGAGKETRIEPADLAALLRLNEEARETIEILEAEIRRLKAAQSASFSGTAEETEILANRLQDVLQQLAEARAKLAAIQSAESLRLPGSPPYIDARAIDTISRELRQSLSSASDHACLLLGGSIGSLEATQRKFLERVQAGIQGMDALVADLAQITAIEAGTFRLNRLPVELLDCIEQALLQAESSLRANSLSLRVDFPDDLPHVSGDRDAIIHVLLHLINNAAGASPEEGEIVVAARLQEGDEGSGARFLALSFSNAGEGIQPADLGRVFDYAGREASARIRGLGETSAGLAMVKTLTEALGGRVWVESDVEVGSTFTVLLPLVDHEPT